MDIAQLVADRLIADGKWVRETTSTNTALLSQEFERTSSGLVLFGAEHQTAGRGRRGNTWHAAAGGLTFSILRQERKPLPLIAFRAGLAVQQALSAIELAHTELKWPNDVLVNGRKIAGILVEHRADVGSIIGIGVNVNNDLSLMPRELRATTTSAADELGAEVDRESMLRGIITRLHIELESSVSDVVAEFHAADAFLGTRVAMTQSDTGQEIASGLALGITSTGAYVVESNGQRHEVHSATLRPCETD